MGHKLNALLGKYLTEQGIEFTSVDRGVTVDSQTGTLDIAYRDKDNRFDVEEIWDVTSFLEFLIDED